eukprot:COSAG04_NODE_1601_length_6193_cov_7.603709_6_plen_269_part_00
MGVGELALRRAEEAGALQFGATVGIIGLGMVGLSSLAFCITYVPSAAFAPPTTKPHAAPPPPPPPPPPPHTHTPPRTRTAAAAALTCVDDTLNPPHHRSATAPVLTTAFCACRASSRCASTRTRPAARWQRSSAPISSSTRTLMALPRQSKTSAAEVRARAFAACGRPFSLGCVLTPVPRCAARSKRRRGAQGRRDQPAGPRHRHRGGFQVGGDPDRDGHLRERRRGGGRRAALRRARLQPRPPPHPLCAALLLSSPLHRSAVLEACC